MNIQSINFLPLAEPSTLFTSACATAIKGQLKDQHSPIECILLLLQALHEESQQVTQAHTQQQAQMLKACLEANQQQGLVLIEKHVQTELRLLASQEDILLGSVAAKILTAGMLSTAAVNAAVGIIPILTTIGALFAAADAAIHTVTYAQQKLGYMPIERFDTQLKNHFTEIATPYLGSATTTIRDYISPLSTLFSTATLVAANIQSLGAFNLYGIGQMVFSGVEAIQGIGIGMTEAELAQLTAQQKTLHTLQGMLKHCLETLQKSLSIDSQAFEEYVSLTSKALEEQAESQRRMIQHIL